MWALIKAFKKRKLNSNREVVSFIEKLEEQLKLISKLCPDSCIDSRETDLAHMKELDESNQTITKELKNAIEIAEVKQAIKSTKIKTVPEFDQIDQNIIKALPEEYILVLTQIFNKILHDGSFPESWSDSLIIPIPKSDGIGVRPISLLSCEFKIMEKVIYNRLL